MADENNCNADSDSEIGKPVVVTLNDSFSDNEYDSDSDIQIVYDTINLVDEPSEAVIIDSNNGVDFTDDFFEIDNTGYSADYDSRSSSAEEEQHNNTTINCTEDVNSENTDNSTKPMSAVNSDGDSDVEIINVIDKLPGDDRISNNDKRIREEINAISTTDAIRNNNNNNSHDDDYDYIQWVENSILTNVEMDNIDIRPHCNAQIKRKTKFIGKCIGKNEQQGDYRPIIIDGCNVAFGFGSQHSFGFTRVFAVRGIELCVDHFLARGHKEIVVILPIEYKTKCGRGKAYDVLIKLETDGYINYVHPCRHENEILKQYDDWYIIQSAMDANGIIVSRDNYSDLMGTDTLPLDNFIRTRVLSYMWFDDQLILPTHPNGPGGIELDEFLRFNP